MQKVFGQLMKVVDVTFNVFIFKFFGQLMKVVDVTFNVFIFKF